MLSVGGTISMKMSVTLWKFPSVGIVYIYLSSIVIFKDMRLANLEMYPIG